jgi:uncharacterized RDD family membrane protein YckC
MTDIVDADPRLASAPSASRPPWTDIEPHPWRRFFARSLDVFLFGGAVLAVLGLVMGLVSPGRAYLLTDLLNGLVGRYVITPVLMVTFAAPFIALSISRTGGTPGKWLFGVRVTDGDGDRLDLRSAFAREVRAAMIGAGLGLPVVSLGLGYQAQAHLTARRVTPWDEAGGHVVTHAPLDRRRIVLMAVGGGLWGAIRLAGLFSQFAG